MKYPTHLVKGRRRFEERLFDDPACLSLISGSNENSCNGAAPTNESYDDDAIPLAAAFWTRQQPRRRGDVPDAALMPSGYSNSMNRPRILLLALAAVFLTLGKARAQYAYVTSNAVVEQRATTAVLPTNPLRVFVYCIIASPGKGEPLAPSVVKMGDATTGVPVQYPDRPPKLWASTSKVWVFSDQTALISCTELVRKQNLGSAPKTTPAPVRR